MLRFLFRILFYYYYLGIFCLFCCIQPLSHLHVSVALADPLSLSLPEYFETFKIQLSPCCVRVARIACMSVTQPGVCLNSQDFENRGGRRGGTDTHIWGGGAALGGKCCIQRQNYLLFNIFCVITCTDYTMELL